MTSGTGRGVDTPDLRSPARGLFRGEIHDEAVFPFPRLSEAEQGRVDKLVDEWRSYADRHYDARRMEAERWIPDEVLRELGELGLLGLYVPEHYGGQGLSETGYCRVFDAVGRVDSTLSVILGSHQSIGYKGIHLYGSDEQKDRFLPDLVRGRKLAAFALTEPNAGSDAYHVECRAQRQVDGSYRLDGEKRYIGNGSRASVLTVFARTDQGRHVALLVEPDMPGFEVGRRYQTMGLAANDLRHLRFRDVRVPRENVLGAEGDGFRIATETLNIGRMSLGSGSASSVRHLLDLALDHTRERRQFGQPLADFELVQQKIAWMASYMYGMEAMSYLTTGMVDRGLRDFRLESAILKVCGTEFLWYAVNRAFQLAGGKAYLTEEPYEKILRDVRVFPIFEGANDVMRLFVAIDGLQTLGDELEDLTRASPRRPLRTATAAVDYARARVSRELAPDHLNGVHPSLTERSRAVTRQTLRLRRAAEKLLRRHGPDIQHEQAQLKRVAHTTFEIFAQIATLSRASAALGPGGAAPDDGGPADNERQQADMFCTRSADRAGRWLDQLDHNDDPTVRRTAAAVYERGVPDLPA